MEGGWQGRDSCLPPASFLDVIVKNDKARAPRRSLSIWSQTAYAWIVKSPKAGRMITDAYWTDSSCSAIVALPALPSCHYSLTALNTNAFRIHAYSTSNIHYILSFVLWILPLASVPLVGQVQKLTAPWFDDLWVTKRRNLDDIQDDTQPQQENTNK